MGCVFWSTVGNASTREWRYNRSQLATTWCVFFHPVTHFIDPNCAEPSRKSQSLLSSSPNRRISNSVRPLPPTPGTMRPPSTSDLCVFTFLLSSKILITGSKVAVVYRPLPGYNLFTIACLNLVSFLPTPPNPSRIKHGIVYSLHPIHVQLMTKHLRFTPATILQLSLSTSRRNHLRHSHLSPPMTTPNRA